MIECDVGGGFGVRGEFYPEDFLIPFAARRLGRPVKWIEDRREHLVCQQSRPRCGMRTGDRLRSRRHHPRPARPRGGRSRRLYPHQWRDRGAQHRADAVGPVPRPAHSRRHRPAGDQQDAVRHLSRARAGSRRISSASGCSTWRRAISNLDRVEFRRRNLIAETEMPYALARVAPLDAESSEADSGDYRATLDRCLAAFDWRERSALQGRLIDGRYHGLGIGCYFEGGGSGPRENARLELERDGSVSVYVGLVLGRAGRRDRARPDRRRRARSAVGRHPRRLSRLDQLSAGRLRLLQFALDRHGRLGDRGGGSELEGQDSRGGGQAARLCRAGGRARRRQGGRARRPGPDRLG